MPLPLPFATTVEVMRRLGSEVTDHPDHVALRTPQLPGHRFGEPVLVKDAGAVDDTARWLRALEATGAARPVVGLPARPTPGVWEAVPVKPWQRSDGTTMPAELHVDTWRALVATQVTPRRPLPAGYEIRLAASDADWAGLADLFGGEEFALAWGRQQRRTAEAGALAMTLATHDGRVVAAAGMVLCDIPDRGRVGRYQDVHTHQDHRRRGLAGHVIEHAHAWALEHGASETVIVADPEKEAIHLYEELGLAPAEDGWMVLPYPAGS